MRLKTLMLFLVPLTLAAACGNQPGETPGATEAVVPIVPDEPTATSPSVQELPAVPETAPELPSPTPEVEEARPVRQDLAATDPESVQLGAGKPTLVEFFAFW